MRMKIVLKALAASVAAWAAAGCVSFPGAPEARLAPHFEDGRLVSIDGAALGLTAWEASDPRAVVVAVHGMNDYANAFKGAAEYWSARGIAVYAYDQRGFGRSPDFGRWPGAATMRADLRAAIAAARAAHPGLPLYLVGHSMGAGLAVTAMAEAPLDVEGVVLAAPGVWGGAQMPVPYRLALNLAASLTPGKTLTGERTGRRSTDNIEILREMFADPLVVKETRMDAILGVVRLMGEAWDASDEAGGRILFLYGEKDEIIPVDKMTAAAARLCGDVDLRRYKDGWHLLFRDLQAETVWRAVAMWIEEQEKRTDAADPVSGAGPATSACAGADGGRSVAMSTRRPGQAGL